MKEKKYKHINEAIEEYLRLTDEELEIPVLIKKAHEKYDLHKEEHNTSTYDPGETDKMFKIFTQVKKYEDRKTEISAELATAEGTLRDFLSFLKGGKISYEHKGSTPKAKKITYLFWLKEDKVQCNR